MKRAYWHKIVENIKREVRKKMVPLPLSKDINNNVHRRNSLYEYKSTGVGSINQCPLIRGLAFIIRELHLWVRCLQNLWHDGVACHHSKEEVVSMTCFPCRFPIFQKTQKLGISIDQPPWSPDPTINCSEESETIHQFNYVENIIGCLKAKTVQVRLNFESIAGGYENIHKDMTGRQSAAWVQVFPWIIC